MEEAVRGRAKRRHLSPGECRELEQSREGTSSLTQPHIFNSGQGSGDPNRWLYPRTPAKLRKCDVASEPQVIDNEVLGREEIDDDSILAAALSSESQANEEKQLDDDSITLIPVTEPNGEVDYLEGMTAEMFGMDDEFERDNHNEEEEVEALPDAHYGLLGSNKTLLQPEGCMDDLPNEVLWQVLCYLPAQDLYRSACLVCHRWKNIVEDPRFLPFKKQYFRYMMKEKDTVLEVLSILKSNDIKDVKHQSSLHSIRELVFFMAQHKVIERVMPEKVLECVMKHRLFPQAEASIRLYITDVKMYCDLGVEGPNPYAAMAAILILSESVADVQALVSLLTGCLSYTAISEYLSRMATMLLAVERCYIKISNRMHYNIYYTLYLMDNGPFSVDSSMSGRPQIQMTCEQQHILSHDIQKDHVVKIIAFAGTGKTTTLVKYAEQRPHLRFLYVAFNKSVKCEAEQRFPRNVSCRTVHSLAFSETGRNYLSCRKLTSNLKAFVINSVLPEGRGGFIKSKVVVTTLNNFMASADQAIATIHVPNTHVSLSGNRVEIDSAEKPLFVRDAQMIWDKMKDLREKKEAYFMTHDGYLKLWQLQKPKPCFSHQYDVLLIDEAQDCSPVVIDVLMSQNCGKILVGDPHQQIYTFRGAVNALNHINHTHIYYLTQSFRFGAEIAFVGATILKVCKGVEKILVGGKQEGGVCDETAVKVAEAMSRGVSHCHGKTAILSRSNLTVFSTAVSLTDANPHCRIHFIGDVKNFGLSRILDIWQLTQGADKQPKFIKDPLIRFFATKSQNAFFALKMYTDRSGDLELFAKVCIVEKYASRIPELVDRLESCFEPDFHRADFIVGTVHKAKGLEFDTVMVTDDFATVPSCKHNLHHNPRFSFDSIPQDEWNLLYVAATRAKTTLIITKTIRRILTFAGEYFLKSTMPGSLMKVGERLPCSVSDCPNRINPRSAFIMCKPQLQCTDGATNGGPLCERCVWARIGAPAFLMCNVVLAEAELRRRLDQRVFLKADYCTGC